MEKMWRFSPETKTRQATGKPVILPGRERLGRAVLENNFVSGLDGESSSD